ncbi:serine/threonine-protein kinase [Streptomyces sp. NPDC012888]|uniref:serine/threonine-protein kinase n=1 Tax=Streptomyces sp. NPDC012888 TaxID=3364855 RepID=UPI0036C5D45A
MNTSEDGRTVVDGRFELIARLGSGGMGTVWRARDTALQREVALKEVRPADPAAAEADPALARHLRDRAVREAQALARLAHPNVVSIHHIVEPADGSHPWIVMELVQGGSLHDRIASGPLPVGEVVRIGLDVLAALRAAHAAGVHHRDVKPANILLRPDGSAVLTDFGIAALRESTSLTATGDLIGSPEYIAPERVRGQEGDPASDLWSLGMTLYVAAEGAHPLRRDTALATIVALLDEPIPYPARAGALAPVLTELLVRDVRARPDAAQLERRLRELVSGSPSVPAGYGPATPFGPPANPYGGTPTPPPHAHAAPPYQAQAHAAQAFAPPGAGTTALSGAGVPPRPGRRRPLLAVLLTAVLVAGTAAAVQNWLPDGDDGGSGGQSQGKAPQDQTQGQGQDQARQPTGGASPSTGGSAATPAPSTPDATQQGSLHTPAGARAMVAALREATGRGDTTRLTVYPTYAAADVPVKDHPTGYQSWSYREGAATKGIIKGAIQSGTVPVQLDKVNWDAVPGLLKQADSRLAVKNPTSRYLIVAPDPIDRSAARLMVYVSNEYGESGYLQCDLTGRVLRAQPHS